MRKVFFSSKYFKATRASVFTLIGFMVFLEVTGHQITIIYNYIVADIDSETSGEIVSSERYKSGKVSYRHEITYGYVVDGKTYFSRTIDYEDAVVDGREKVAKYHEGKQVRVYYDSSKPHLAVLEVTDLGIGIVISLIVVFLISVFVFIWNIHETPKYKRFKPEKKRKW